MTRLETIHKAILSGHVALSVGAWLVGFVSVGDSDGWAGLARAAITILAVAYLAGIAMTWLLMRFGFRGRAARLALAVLGPPVAVVIVMGVLRSG